MVGAFWSLSVVVVVGAFLRRCQSRARLPEKSVCLSISYRLDKSQDLLLKSKICYGDVAMA